jgi:LemA protein
MKSKAWIVIAIIALVLVLGVLGSYNGLVKKSQVVETSAAQIQADYQRRNDLIPNLVSTVKGAANFEQTTLIQVVEARANATKVNLNVNDPASIAAFQNAQSQVSSSLSRLLVVAENYPQLTATESFKGLQTQLEGTENRIAVSRKDFNNAVQSYNTAVKVFPGSVIASLFGFEAKVYFEAESGAQVVPKVEFGN